MAPLIIMFLTLSVFAQEDNPVVMITDRSEISRNGCWATIYEGDDFQGSSLTIFNGYDVENLEFSAGPIWREKIRSIVAGSTARITLYPQDNFKGQEYIIHPSSHVEKLPWEDVKSLKLTCVTLEGRTERHR